MAWSPARISLEERQADLNNLDSRLQNLFDEAPLQLPRREDFLNGGTDQQHRYMVVVQRRQEPADYDINLLAQLARLKRNGILLDAHIASPEAPNWRAFLTFRAVNQQQVETHLQSLSLADDLAFDITQLARP